MDGDAARAQRLLAQLRRPAPHVHRLHLAQRHLGRGGLLLQAQQGIVDHLHAARRQPALDTQVLDVGLQRRAQGVGRAAHACGLGACQALASSRDRLALATSPMRDRNSVPICAA